MAKIFISYRREDAQWQTRALYNALSRHVETPSEDIFYDLDSMTVGLNFKRQIEETVQKCDMLLAVIGRDWLTIADEAGNRRLDDPNDFVRLEIAAALERDIRVVPVLLDGTDVPLASALPEELRELSQRHGVKIRAESFDADAHVLVKGLGLVAPARDHGEEAWQQIEASLAPGEYEAFAAQYGDHPRAFEAARRLRQLSAYGAVDASNGEAIARFRQEAAAADPLFPALEEKSRADMDQAAAPYPELAAPAPEPDTGGGGARGLVLALIAIALIAAGGATAHLFGLIPSPRGSAPPPQMVDAPPARVSPLAALVPVLVDLLSDDDQVRDDARVELTKAMEAAGDGDLNRSVLEELSKRTGRDAYRARMGGAVAIAGLTPPVEMDDRSGAVSLLEVWRAEAGDRTLERRIEDALRALSPDWQSPEEARAAAAARSEAVRALQTELRRLGHYTSVIDGDAGPGTQRAANAFTDSQSRAALTLSTASNAQIEALTARARRAEPPFDAVAARRRANAAKDRGDHAAANRDYEPACAAGDALSCNNLGYNHLHARGVAQDYDRARRLYDQACTVGTMAGCNNLGWLNEKALGVAQDYDRARRLYDQACTGGDMAGCYNLGSLYEKALGVAQDYDRARRLYDQACTGGIMAGCNNLGKLYYDGKGVAVDRTRSRELHQMACDGGNETACDTLANFYD
ncbi:MAG: TIR domain-containing protein [Pseudomonadota bacterium]